MRCQLQLSTAAISLFLVFCCGCQTSREGTDYFQQAEREHIQSARDSSPAPTPTEETLGPIGRRTSEASQIIHPVTHQSEQSQDSTGVINADRVMPTNAAKTAGPSPGRPAQMSLIPEEPTGGSGSASASTESIPADESPAQTDPVDLLAAFQTVGERVSAVAHVPFAVRFGTLEHSQPRVHRTNSGQIFLSTALLERLVTVDTLAWVMAWQIAEHAADEEFINQHADALQNSAHPGTDALMNTALTQQKQRENRRARRAETVERGLRWAREAGFQAPDLADALGLLHRLGC